MAANVEEEVDSKRRLPILRRRDICFDLFFNEKLREHLFVCKPIYRDINSRVYIRLYNIDSLAIRDKLRITHHGGLTISNACALPCKI